MSTFFGLTMLGDEHMMGTRVKRKSEASSSCMEGKCLHHVGLEEFLRAFQRVAKSNPCNDNSCTSNPNPNPNPNSSTQIRRALLPSIISDVLCRPPTIAEMDLFLRYLSYPFSLSLSLAFKVISVSVPLIQQIF